jgi:hypothetical protein
MPRLSRSDLAMAALFAAAVLFAGLGFAGLGEGPSNGLLFVAWCLALLALFVLAIRLPLRGRGSQLAAFAANGLIAAAAVAVVVAANIALYRHDLHLDVTREGRNTPPSQLTDVIGQLRVPLRLTYFYNAGDPNALALRDIVEIAARNHPAFMFSAIDLDKEPGRARDIGVHSYNTAVLEAADRKVMVENVTDAARLGYAALRVLRRRAETVCFVTGHGETFRATAGHFHYSHAETLKGHDTPGEGDVLVAEPEQLDRLQLALNEIGLETRGVVLATAESIPPDCAAVAEIGPRVALAQGEAEKLAEYLRGGGRLLLLIDPQFPLSPELEGRLLEPLGLSSEPAIVIDPQNHFRTDPDKVAVPYYPPHPITARLALTIFPQARPIHLAAPPTAVKTIVLAASSQNSFLRPPSDAADPAVASRGERGAQALAVALEGAWPGAAGGPPFRLVVAGTSKFASNEYFPYVSNGEMSVAMIRWLAADDAAPNLAPRSYALSEIVLTSRQMRDTFIALEILLPLSTILFGVLLWWRRR